MEKGSTKRKNIERKLGLKTIQRDFINSLKLKSIKRFQIKNDLFEIV